MIFGRKWPRIAYTGRRNRQPPTTTQRWLLGVVFVLIISPLLGVVYTYTRGGESARVHAATASTLNFQARLLNSSGSLVADGSYGIEFKLYDAVTAGTNEWTETQSVTVKNGYLSAYLGNVTPFPGTINWSQEKWLTMNVNGDGEMTPRIKLTAVPYAFRAGQADTLTLGSGTVSAAALAQLAPGSLQSVNSAVAGLRINQVGSGGLLQFATGGSDMFTVSNAGNGVLAGTLAVQGSRITVGTASQSGLLVLNSGSGSNTSLQASATGLNITSGGNISIGTADTAGTLLVLDTKTDNPDPTGINGAMYYNSSRSKFRCYQGGQWQDCVNGSNYNATASLVSGLINVPANTAGSVIEEMVFTTATAVSNVAGSTGFTAPAGGSFRTCLVKNNAAITNGTINLRWQVNGISVGAGACTMTNAAATNRQATSSLDPGVVTFSAGDTVGIAFDTNATYAPATNDYTVYWTVEYNSTLGGGAATPSLQLAYNNSLNNEITLDSTRNGLTILDNATPITGNLLEVKNNGGGTTYFGVSATGVTSANTLTVNSGGLAVTGNSTIAGTLSGLTTLAAGTGTFNVNANGSLTSTFTALNGTSTANGSGTNSTTLILTSATNFDVGNYVQVSATNCGGAGVNICYAKITNKVTNTLTITPALTWTNGVTVNEYHVPEIGGNDTTSTLTNRYGRGYFISGVAVGNGTTYYGEDGIDSNLSSFNLLNSNVTTLNFGGAATTLNIGSAATTVNVVGNLATAGSQTITAGGGLVVSSGGSNITGGINNNNGGITATGALNGVTTISASGAISGATATNTINGLIINTGTLSGITGFTQTSGNFAISGTGTFGTGTGAISLNGATTVTGTNTLTVSGGLSTLSAGLTLTGTTSINTTGAAAINIATGVSTSTVTIGGGASPFALNSTNFDVSTAGALSGITTLSANGALTAATTINTINGLIVNAGSLSGVTGFTQASGNFAISGVGSIDIGAGSNALTINSTSFDVSSGGALSGITTLAASGALSAATTVNTINGLIVNTGSLSAVTGFNQASGNFAVSGTGTFGTGSGAVNLNGATTVSTSTASTTALTVNGTSGTAATALQIAQTGNAANLAMTNTARTAGALVSLTQSTSAFTGTGLLFNFASGSGSFASGNFLDFQLNGTTRFKIDSSGAVQINSDSTAALQVRSANGTVSFFNVDDTGNLVQIGSSTTDARAILTVLDSYNNVTDPAGVNGGSYYNSTRGKYRCFENSAWKDCITSTKAIKTANQTITNNAAFQNDTDLKFTMVANSFYTFTAAINFSATSAASDFKYTFTVPAGATVAITSVAPTAAAATTTCVITASGQTCTLVSTANYRSTMMITGYVANGGTAGDLQFQFAQDTAAGGQSAIVYRGSSLLWDRTQ